MSKKKNNDWLEMLNLLWMLPLIGIILWVIVWFMMSITFTFTMMRATHRCTVHGYEKRDVVVDFPLFWAADTYCYNGEQRNDGIKL